MPVWKREIDSMVISAALNLTAVMPGSSYPLNKAFYTILKGLTS